MQAPIVFFDLAGSDSAQLGKFYNEVFGWNIGPGGSLNVPIAGAPNLMGTIRQDPSEKVLYIGVPDVTKSLNDVAAHGGKIQTPRFEVKGVVVLGLFSDPAGNRMGLVEMGPDGKNKIP